MLGTAALVLTVYFIFNWPADFIDKAAVVEFLGTIYVTAGAAFVLGYLANAVSVSVKAVTDYLAISLLPPLDQAMHREVEEFRKFQTSRMATTELTEANSLKEEDAIRANE